MRKILIMATIALASAVAGCSSTDSVDKSASSPSTQGNAAYENIMTRSSVRSYQPDRAVSPDTVEMLLRAAMAAPTAVNKQPWAFMVLDNRESIDSLAEVLPYAKMLNHAPLAVVVCGDMELALEGDARDFWIQDVSAATENLLLAAHSLGLGAVWTGVYPNADRVKGVTERLGLPSYIIPLAVVPIGYPDGEQTPKDKWVASKVHYNRW